MDLSVGAQQEVRNASVASLPSSKAKLSPGLITYNCHSIREVEAAVIGLHWNSYGMVSAQLPMNAFRQTAGFRSKKKYIIYLIVNLIIANASPGRAGKNSFSIDGGEKLFEVGMQGNVG
jgi:hypothetical protein